MLYMADESGEGQIPTTEAPKTPDNLTPAQRFQTTVDTLLDHYKSLPPTSNTEDVSYPRYSMTPKGEEISLIKPLGSAEMLIQEWIKRTTDGKIEWGFVSQVGHTTSGPIFWEDKIVKDGDNVTSTISDWTDAEPTPKVETYELSKPEDNKTVELQLRNAIINLQPYLPQTPK